MIRVCGEGREEKPWAASAKVSKGKALPGRAMLTPPLVGNSSKPLHPTPDSPCP